MIIHFIIIILSHLTMTLLSFRMARSKKEKLAGQFPGAAWSRPALTATHGIIARCLHHGSIVIHPQRAGGREMQLLGTHAPPYPFLVARAQPGHLELTWCKLGFQGDGGAESASSTSHSTSSFPKSVGPPSSPTTWRDGIVSEQPWYTNKPDYVNVTVERDAACSNLHINLDHYSFLDLARKRSPSSSSLSVQSWRTICKVTFLLQ